MDMLYFFLPMVLFLGIVTSYEDIKGRGIRNKWVILALVYSFIVLFSIIIYLFLSGQGIIFSYIPDYFINIVISLAFGFIIWYAGFWSAGDGKLFFAYSALIPLSVYSMGYIRFFPSFSLFINTLLPVFVFLVGGLLLRTSFRKKADILKKSFNPNLFLRAVFSLFGLSWLIRMLFLFMGIQYDMFSFLILIPIVYILIGSLARKRMNWFFIILVVLRFAFDYNYILSLSFVYRFVYIIVFYVFIRYFIFGLSSEFFSKSVNVQKIRKGMILADTIYKDGEKYVKQPQGFLEFSMKQKNTGKPVFNRRNLAKEDVEKLKKLHKEGKIDSELRIQTTMPFAIFMFLGVLLTIAFQGNIIIAAKSFFGL